MDAIKVERERWT